MFVGCYVSKRGEEVRVEAVGTGQEGLIQLSTCMVPRRHTQAFLEGERGGEEKENIGTCASFKYLPGVLCR